MPVVTIKCSLVKGITVVLATVITPAVPDDTQRKLGILCPSLRESILEIAVVIVWPQSLKSVEGGQKNGVVCEIQVLSQSTVGISRYSHDANGNGNASDHGRGRNPSRLSPVGIS